MNCERLSIKHVTFPIADIVAPVTNRQKQLEFLDFVSKPRLEFVSNAVSPK